jgi:hypothetical protein
MMVRCDCLVNCSNAGNKTCGSAHMAIAGNELSMRDLQGLTALRRGEEQGGHRCAVFQILAVAAAATRSSSVRRPPRLPHPICQLVATAKRNAL